MPLPTPKTCWRFVVIGNYYLAALMLVVAGWFKAAAPQVSDLLLTLYEIDFLAFQTIITISRWQPWLEIGLGTVALSGAAMLWSARLMAALYLFFFVLILVASQGYLLLPVDCGCFAEDNATPAYLLLIRNGIIALLLLLLRPSHTRAALWPRVAALLPSRAS
jgi:hypothetical protein